MQTYSGRYPDDLTVQHPVMVSGKVSGNLTIHATKREAVTNGQSTVSGKISGDFVTEAPVRLSGAVSGDVTCQANSSISGRVSGDLLADGCIVRLSGQISGDAKAVRGGRIICASGSQVHGDLVDGQDAPQPSDQIAPGDVAEDDEKKQARERVRALADSEGVTLPDAPKRKTARKSLSERLVTRAAQSGRYFVGGSTISGSTVRANGHDIKVEAGKLSVDGRQVDAKPGRNRGVSSSSDQNGSQITIEGFDIRISGGKIVVNGQDI
jgi:cytoskeletal protein CcmA (bactofilin family)